MTFDDDRPGHAEQRHGAAPWPSTTSPRGRPPRAASTTHGLPVAAGGGPPPTDSAGIPGSPLSANRGALGAAFEASGDPAPGALGMFEKLAAASSQDRGKTQTDGAAQNRRHRAGMQRVAAKLMPRLSVGQCMNRPGFQTGDPSRELGPDGKTAPHRDYFVLGKGGRTWTVDSYGRKAGVLGERSVELVVGETGVARWTGLHTCGSPWTCPWCAPRIADERRAELVGALANHRAVDPLTGAAQGGVGMVSFTAPHQVHDALIDLKRAMLAAARAMAAHRQYKAIRAELGCIGTIRATEVTYGRNGWHLHFHVVWLQATPMTDEDASRLKSVLYPLWRDACRGEGLGEPSWEHGVDVGCGSHPDEYVTKFGDVDELCPSRAPRWGVAEELTLNAVKVGRGADSVNPWGLLLAAKNGDQLAARLWCEYAAAMKGVAQLVWSRGLKAKLRLDELDDQELAAKAPQEEVVARLPVRGDEFRLLVRHRLRLRLLEVAETAYAAGDDPVVACMVVLGQMREYEARGDGRISVRRPVPGTPWAT